MSDQDNTMIEVKPQNQLPQIETINGVPYALLPEGTSVKDLPEYLKRPIHLKDNVTLLDLDSFLKYVETYDSGSGAVFFDNANLTFKAVIDYHLQSKPDNCKHTATFTLERSRELTAWQNANGRPMSQDQWLDFLEDRDIDFDTPSPAEIITVIRDFRAKKVSEFKSVRVLESGDVDVQFTTDTQTVGKVQVPREISLRLPLFKNGDLTPVKGLFRYAIREGELRMTIVLPRIDDLIDAQAKAIAAAVSTGLGAPLYLGRR